ncbi:MAG: rhodanese-like domain-containing protein [Patescibacteria group bacterium]
MNINKQFLLSKLKWSALLGLVVFAFWFGINYEKVNQLAGTSEKITLVKVAKNQVINALDLKKLLDEKDVFVINVHTPYEGEIPKTDIFVPYDELIANQAKLPNNKSTQIIVYCKSGNMSGAAVKTLNDLGYKNVKHLDGGMEAWQKSNLGLLDLNSLPAKVLPESGFELPIVWGKMGPELIKLGVIDLQKFEKLVQMTDDEKKILTQGSNEKIIINSRNSQFVVDILWAYGLAQKSAVYDEGPMGKEYKKDAGSFASTGGWSLAKGNAMDHYNKHNLIALSDEQHQRIMAITKGIYRPCCGNPTSFPDCNHGMAALAAVELMVKAGLTDDEIYNNVLKLNSFWFGSTYMATATYFARQGTPWESVDAKEVLSQKYSSSKGAAEITKLVGDLPFQKPSAGGCGA